MLELITKIPQRRLYFSKPHELQIIMSGFLTRCFMSNILQNRKDNLRVFNLIVVTCASKHALNQIEEVFSNFPESLNDETTNYANTPDNLTVSAIRAIKYNFSSVKINFPNSIRAAYQVSIEYMMKKAAAEVGYMDERTAMTESLTAIKRAGSDYIITYNTNEVSFRSEQVKVSVRKVL